MSFRIIHHTLLCLLDLLYHHLPSLSLSAASQQSSDITKLYGDVNIAAKKVLSKLSESGIIHSSPPDTDELELGMSDYR
jgi:hypothetical protein